MCGFAGDSVVCGFAGILGQEDWGHRTQFFVVFCRRSDKPRSVL